MSVSRMLRVNELVKREVADLLERETMPSSCMVSVTDVSVTPDLRHAKVSVSVYGGNDETKSMVMKKLNSCRNAIQSKMGRDLKIKYTPVLSFVIDKTIAEANRVLSIIDELEKDDD